MHLYFRPLLLPLLATALLTCHIAVAQNTAPAPRTVVSGKINGANAGTVASLLIFANPFVQQPFKFDAPLQADGTFKIAFQLPVSVPATLSFSTGVQQAILLEPADSLAINATFSGNALGNLQFTGKGAANNQVLIAQNTRFAPGNATYNAYDKIKDLDAKKYRSFVDSIRKVQRDYFAQNKQNTPQTTPALDNLVFSNIDYPWGAALMDYPQMNARYNAKNTYSVDANYYTFLNEMPVVNDAAIFIKSYTDFIDKFINERFALEVINANKDYDMENMYADRYEFAKKYLQGEALSFAACKAILEGLMQGRIELIKPKMDEYLKTNKRVEYSQVIQTIFDQLKHLEAGQIAPDYKLNTIDGKQIALSDLKGKVVYLDFWATWCGPCKQQLPHSIELKKKLGGQPVEFVYISTDTNLEAWKKMVAEKQLPGLHLSAGTSGIQNKYHVTGIPKYLVIGKDGKIANSHARRPSDPRTYDMLKNLAELK
jgi:thiol-disulfide isomerase/thioredoxin